MSPRSALPPGYRLGPDNQSWLMKLKKKVQIWLAAGPRVPDGFFKWREYPKLLFIRRGEGWLRWEDSLGKYITQVVETDEKENFWAINHKIQVYLSRIQPWTRWHVVLQWPLYFNCHFIYRKKDVVQYPQYQSEFGVCKMLTFGIGFKRDSDKIYFLTTNFGGNFE